MDNRMIMGIGGLCMENIVFKTRGTCSRQISVSIEDGIVKSVKFNSGCDGNLQGISQLVEGMSVEDVIKRLKGIDCQGRGTSCPDQLAKALESSIQKAV
jgi:uncharacterized protein (TIGR03905 family)